MNTTSNANTDPMLVPLFLLLLTSSPTFDNPFQCCILRSQDHDWDQRQGGRLTWIDVDWIAIPLYRYKSQQYTSRPASSTQALCTVHHWRRYAGNGKERHVGRSSLVRDTFIVVIISFTWCRVLKFLLSPSNTSQSSNLICRVYKTPRRIGRALDHGNELVGIMEEEIPLLLGGAFSKGLSLSSHCRLWFSNFLFICLEIIQPLNKPIDPGLPLRNTTIHFSVSILEHTSPVVGGLYFLHKKYLIALKLPMPADPTTQAILDISPALESAEAAHMKMQSGPQNTASALKVGVDIVASDCFSTNYGLLVEHIQAFIGISDKLSEVSCQYFLYYMISIINLNIVSPICQGCMGHTVSHSQGVWNGRVIFHLLNLINLLDYFAPDWTWW